MFMHPRPNDHGHPVPISHPHTATPREAWLDARTLATAVPDSIMPASLNGIPFQAWGEAPSNEEGWSSLGAPNPFDEPPFDPKGMKPAAGAVVVEPDGRIWAVAPSNAFGGYRATFPKGKTEGLGLRATAIKEAFEESGLHVELIGHLVDVQRSTSRTRYYLARRIGGTPAAMGWESQAVHLAPMELLRTLLHHANDRPILEALQKALPVLHHA